MKMEVLNTIKNTREYLLHVEQINNLYSFTSNTVKKEYIEQCNNITQAYYRVLNKLIYSHPYTQSYRTVIIENKEDITQVLHTLLNQAVILLLNDLKNETFPVKKYDSVKDKNFTVLYGIEDYYKGKIEFVNIYTYLLLKIFKTFRNYIIKHYIKTANNTASAYEEKYSDEEGNTVSILDMIATKCIQLEVIEVNEFIQQIRGSLTDRQFLILKCLLNGEALNKYKIGGSQLIALRNKLIKLYQM